VTKRAFLKKIKIFSLSLILFANMVSAAGCSKEEDDGSGYTFTYTLHGNPQNLDPQLATDRSSLMVIKNMFLGLMTFDAEGELTCGVAESFTVSEDGLRYSFTLRDDCYWYSADGTESVVTAHDFVYAFKRIFDPQTRSPYREKFSFIHNARTIIDGNMDYSELGVYAVNNTELVFHLDRSNSEFLYLLTTPPAMPCNKQFFEGTKARYGLDEESVISNGAFYMTQWSYDDYGTDNLIYMKRNYDNSQYDRVFPYMLTFIIDRDKDAPADNFNSSLTDCYISETEQKKTFMGTSSTRGYEVASVGITFNRELDIDKDIKKALLLAIDRESLDNMDTDGFRSAYGIVPGGLKLGGKSFRNSVPDSENELYQSEMPTITEKEAEELYSCTDDAKVLVRNTADAGLMSKIIADWQDELGIYIGIDYVSDSEYYSRLSRGEYFMAFREITCEDNSVYYYLLNFADTVFGDDASSFTGELDSAVMLSEAEALDIFSRVEGDIIDSGDYIPLFYKKSFLVSNKKTDDLYFDPFSGQIDFRYAKFFE